MTAIHGSHITIDGYTYERDELGAYLGECECCGNPIFEELVHYRVRGEHWICSEKCLLDYVDIEVFD